MQHTRAPWRFCATARRAAATAVAAAGCLLPALACAHGANLDYQMTPGITLQAKYDAGGPMTQAQFTVYAPNDPTTPWLTGKSDAQGRFSFVPDANIPGMWAVQAREAGHGALVQIPIGDSNGSSDATAATATTNASAAAPTMQSAVHTQGVSPMQRWVMVASVAWGFIGTALFFARKKAT